MEIASINAAEIRKGQTIPGNLAWEHFVNRKPHKLTEWVIRFGSEESAKLAKLSYVLMQVIGWIDNERSKDGMPPVIMNTVGGDINVLTDEKASSYLDNQAFQGLRKHARSTSRLVTAVDENQLTNSERRTHQNRINVHSFILSSAQGAQKQLKVLKKAGKDTPKLID